MPPLPEPVHLDQHHEPAPPPGFGRPSETASEVAAAMTPMEGFGGGMPDAPQGLGLPRDDGPDLITVPPITPDFFARSGRRRR